jgi:methionine biosynthesis protein MetW
MDIAQSPYKTRDAEQLVSGLRPDLLALARLIRQGEKVLDLGCGDGMLLRYLVDTKGVIGRGIELFEEGVLACVHKGLSVRQGDLNEGLGDYPDGSFDTVILSDTIPYLNNPSHIIHEMLRVGQRAIVSFPNWGYWRCRLNFLLTGRMPIAPERSAVWDGSPRARPLTIGDFEDFCQRQDFRIAQRICLRGDCPIASGFGRNLRATMTIFILNCH